MNKIAFTKDGLGKLKKEYEELMEKRKEAVKDLSDARNMGDLSENGAYRANKSKLISIDSRLRYLTKTINSAYIVEKPQTGIVGIGSFVTIIDDQNNTTTLQIVGSNESDIGNNKISCYSPIGKAMIGRKEKDQIEITTPSRRIKYQLQKVE